MPTRDLISSLLRVLTVASRLKALTESPRCLKCLKAGIALFDDLIFPIRSSNGRDPLKLGTPLRPKIDAPRVRTVSLQ